MALTEQDEILLAELLLLEDRDRKILEKVKGFSNESFIPLFTNYSRYLVLKGGGGSGKSIFAGQKVLHRITTEPGHRILVARKVGKTLRESCFEQLQIQAGLYYDSLDFKVNKTDMSITYLPNGNRILFSGLDDVEKLKSIVNVTSIWIEEASELEESDFNQLDIRMRGESLHYKQIILSFNPVSISHWLKARFFDKSDPDATTSETTYHDNRFLDGPAIKVLEGFKLTDPYYYQVYCLGQWGILGKIVFDAQKLAERQTNVERLPFYRLDDTAPFRGFTEDVNGCWQVFAEPRANARYCMGIDVAEGLEGGDYSTIQVLDNLTLEQVAEYKGHIDPDKLAEEAYAAGMLYNRALIAVEVNMEGGVQRNLERMGYPNMYMREVLDEMTHKLVKKFGWRTTETSRRLLVSNLIEYVREHVHLINGRQTIDEMLTFVRNKNGRPEAQEGKNDDLVLAYGIALEACLSGQQGNVSFERTYDYAKIGRMPEDFQADFARAPDGMRREMADRLNLWRV